MYGYLTWKKKRKELSVCNRQEKGKAVSSSSELLYYQQNSEEAEIDDFFNTAIVSEKEMIYKADWELPIPQLLEKPDTRNEYRRPRSLSTCYTKLIWHISCGEVF